MISFYGGEAAGLSSATNSTSTARSSSPRGWRACPYATPPHGRWSGWSRWRWAGSPPVASAPRYRDAVVPFAESVEAYRAIDEQPHRSIKLGVTFP